MSNLSLALPHRPMAGMCPVNGIRDLVHWRAGRDWSNPFVHGLGQGGGFAYLRVNPADPPRQVFWGNATPRQHRYLAELLGARFNEMEGRSFKFVWDQARASLEAGIPAIIGPLDMFHLPFYPGIYHQRHIPIHFLLLVGCDRDSALVLDTGQQEVQSLPLQDLQAAWNVHVPGLGKRNRLAIIDLPADIPPTAALVRKAIADECQLMLHPPVSMLGIPAMQKLARELPGWPQELEDARLERSLLQVLEYLNSPPDLLGGHLTAGRDLYITFLEEAGDAAGLDVSAAIQCLHESIAVIPALAQALRERRLAEAGRHVAEIAALEKGAFTELQHQVTSPVPTSGPDTRNDLPSKRGGKMG